MERNKGHINGRDWIRSKEKKVKSRKDRKRDIHNGMEERVIGSSFELLQMEKRVGKRGV